MGISNTLSASPVTVNDVYKPQLTVYEDENPNPVQHIKSWSTWRNISSIQAEELALCELAFRTTIREKILTYIDGFRGSSLPQESIFTVKVNLVELAIRILNACEDSCFSPSPLLNLQNLVQFVRLHDCFARSAGAIDDIRTARIRVRLPQNSTSPVITASPPRIVFNDMTTRAEQGQNYYLRPRYTPTFDLSKDSQCYPHVTYTTTCDWLKYNTKESRFEGTMPQTASLHDIVRIPIKAKIVYPFPGTGVRHEEVIHAAVMVTRYSAFGDFRNNTLEKPASTLPIKHVRFADKPMLEESFRLSVARMDDIKPMASSPPPKKAKVGKHVYKKLDNALLPLLRSRNSFSALQGRSDMDQNHLRMASSSTSDDEYSSPDSELDKLDLTSCTSDYSGHATVPAKKMDDPFCHLFEEDAFPPLPTANKNSESGRRKRKNLDVGLDGACEEDEGPSNIEFPPLHPGYKDEDVKAQTAQAGETLGGLSKMVEFGTDEDPRDVREMTKALLQMELQDLEKSMLGRRIDKWSGSEEIYGLSDIQESGEDSGLLENSLRDSMGF